MNESGGPVYALPRVPGVRKISRDEIGLAVRRGIADFARAPIYGLAFGLFITAGGVLAILTLTVFDAAWLSILIAVVFPLIFPFITAGLYEISRRLSVGEVVTWAGIVGAVWRQRERQMGWMAFVVLFVFWIWIYQVRILLAIFMGSAASANLEKFLWQTVSTTGGIEFLAVGSIIGLALALVLFCATVVSLPLLFDTELDFVTAMIVSFQAATTNPAPMFGLGVLLTIATVVALVPACLGMIVIVPVFGHATWHLYTLVTDRARPTPT